MKIKFLLPILFLYLTACNPKKQEPEVEKFDKLKWAIQEGDNYPYRDAMLMDLIGNKRLTGTKRNDILNMLGEPSRMDTNYIFYRINQTKLGDVVPLHTKTLVIEFAADSTVRTSKIHQ